MERNDDFSAYLKGDNGGSVLRLTDSLRLENGGAEFFNRLETQCLVELRCGFGSFVFQTRFEIQDDLSALADALALLSERKSNVLNWGTSNGLLEITCEWNSSLDILCRVKVGQYIAMANSDLFLRRDDWLESYEAIFVIILPDVDEFLAGVRRMLSWYEPVTPF